MINVVEAEDNVGHLSCLRDWNKNIMDKMKKMS